MAGLLLKQTRIFIVLYKYLMTKKQFFKIKDNGEFLSRGKEIERNIEVFRALEALQQVKTSQAVSQRGVTQQVSQQIREKKNATQV